MNSASLVDALLAAHRADLLAFAERRLGSLAVAEDVVQQAAVRALDAAGDLRDARSGRAWLFKITRRLVADHFRERLGAALAPELEGMRRPDGFGCACVLANLEQLKPDFAHLLRRVIVDGVPLATIAAQLGLSSNAAAVRLSRARAALRARLHAHCGTQSLRECLDCACDERGCCNLHGDEVAHET